MAAVCRECGAELPEEGGCIGRFHALLLLEYEVAGASGANPDGSGEVAHFHAVGSYILQHPEGMNYTPEALAGLRRSLADQLAGEATMPELRARTRRAADGATRVTRRAGDVVVRWPIAAWPITVADVLAGGVPRYAERVARWAESILRTLDEAGC
jgi:hypothetical protein